MPDPALALFVFAVVVILGAAVLWPSSGLLARIVRLLPRSEQVLLEDALKHLYMCRRSGRTVSLESLAGRLEISRGRAADLLSKLGEAGWVELGRSVPELTRSGQDAALRLVRSHRLWERYLADRTGVPAREWHEHAERMEHALTAEDADILESRLGHPRWDPHGDPIPTSAGELPPLRGGSLLGVAPGTAVEIVHLEDEPHEIYDRLVADGLAPGGRLDVLSRSEKGVRVSGVGRVWTVGTMEAQNVTVRSLPEGERVTDRHRTLLDAAPGETVRVAAIASACQGTQRRRLLDLGVVRGTEITPEFVSASGDPVAYRIRGALIALRREQASWIEIEHPAPAVSDSGLSVG